MDKDLRKVVKALRAEGYEVEVTKRGHVSVYRDCHFVTMFAGTASDWRSMKNALAPLRRDGFDWPPKK